MENLKIEYVPIDSIKPYERNAKLHPQEQVEQIKKSIRDNGMNDPIGVWHDTVVEGHGRLLPCQELGMAEVPVIRLDHMTDEQRREYMLVHNQTTMNSGWDAEILTAELGDLIDFDAGFYGFDIDTEEYGVEDETEPKEKPTDALPDSRICVFSVSAFGTDSECFVEVQLSEDEAARLLERVKEVEISDIAERLKEVLNAL